jgi:GAF domain-containing protein/HAMP domain-containing protein
MSDRKAPINGSGNGSRQVFRLSPSLHFTNPGRKPSLFFTLRARLIVSLLFVALAPTALLAYFDARATQTALTNAANEALLSAARQTKDSIDAFIKTHLYALSEDTNDANLSAYLAMSSSQQPGSDQEKTARAQLNADYARDYRLNNYILSYVLINKDGKVLLDTSNEHPEQTPFLNLDKVDPTLFNLMLSSDRPYISSIIFPPGSGIPVFYFVASVKDQTRLVSGILAARYNAALIQSFIDQSQELGGPLSYAVVYDDNLLRLAQGASSELVYKTVVPLDPARLASLQKIGRIPTGNNLSTNIPALASGLGQVDQTPYFTTKTSETGGEINAAAAIQLENKNWTVAYLQPQSVFLAPLRIQTLNTVFMALAIAAGAILLGLFITRRLTRPIERLTRTAEKVSHGDLWAQAPESQDEIGALAAAFNTMTSELRRSLEGLEQRIAERTSQLAHASEQMKRRVNQLQTVTQVAHAVASVQDQERLLPLIAQLISDRFGYYHTGIFLLDEKGEYAILRAASSEGGQQMLAHHHKLKVGEDSIVSLVTRQGEPRIALDVGEDAVSFDNTDLPKTRSEMALPLKIGEKVIGALDVQSEKPFAFSEEDLNVLSTMADQVAIALENARLFSETHHALTELQRLHGQYLQQQWAQAVITTRKSGYRYINGELEPIPAGGAVEPWENVTRDESALLTSNRDNPEGEHAPTNLVVPITVRGQVIGLYQLGEPPQAGGWKKEDIEFVKAIADQVGLALENARLLEQTQTRAEREHLVSEITSKMRASNDPQVILETAKRELRQALRAKEAEIVLPDKSREGKPSNESPGELKGNGYKASDRGNTEPGVRGDP